MKIFKNCEEAAFRAEKDQSYISKFCPFHVRMSTRTLCGSWCPHFFIEPADPTSGHGEEIYITCSGQEVCVGVKDA